jgi:glycosyltransferase involved in cell wall biosynthesis
VALKITLVTSSHLSSNPRLVKEAKTLLAAHYELYILCAQNLEELSKFDEEIFKELSQADIYIINYQNNTIKGRYLRIKSAIRSKLARIKLFKSLPVYKLVLQSRMLPEMKTALKNIKTDLYIAHTLAALPAAAWAANYHKSKYAFDAEDFHSGETNHLINRERIISFENEFLKDCSYISTASPLSTKLYQFRYPNLKIITLNNVFPFNYLDNEKVSVSKPVRLVWFSQTLGLNRGIKEFFTAINHLDTKSFELHLRGSHKPNIKNELLKTIDMKWHSRIFFYPQCAPGDLGDWLKQFDIGLALEIKENLNKDICISNKIFQYISAGLAVIATNTQGQKWVLTQAPNIGVVIPHDKMELAAEQLKYWSENIEQLKITKQNSINAAQSLFNWDLEKNKLLQQISIF